MGLYTRYDLSSVVEERVGPPFGRGFGRSRDHQVVSTK
jgi:hypothetical protein